MSSCGNCVNARYSPALGIYHCFARDLPLGSDPEGKLAEAFASDCVEFSRLDTNAAHEVDDPDFIQFGHAESYLTASASDVSRRDPRPPRALKCEDCAYYASATSMNDFMGIRSGACVVNAAIMNPAYSEGNARACTVNVLDTSNFTGDLSRSIRLYSEIAVAVEIAGRAPKASASVGGKSGVTEPGFHSSVDPRDWESDRMLTLDDVRSGIRAWRRVVDPAGQGPDIFMPIMQWDAIKDAEGKLLFTTDPRDSYSGSKPWLYFDHSGLLYTAAALLMGGVSPTKALSMNLTLRGEAGTGKTEFFTWMAWLMDVPFTRIAITPSTEVYSLEGKDGIVNGDTAFQMSRFAKAYDKPGVICIDEWNAGSDEVQFFMRPLIDSTRQFSIESEGLIVRRNPFCFIGFTMNPEDNPAYRGTRPLSEADWDRLMVERLDLPTADIERMIILAHLADDGLEISDQKLDMLMDIATSLRSKYASGEMSAPWRLRSQIKVAKALSFFSVERAFRLALGNRLDDVQAEIVMSEVRNLVG